MNFVLTHLPLKPGNGNGFVAGRTVVSADFLEALCQYSGDDRIIVYTPEGSYQSYRDELRNYRYRIQIELLGKLELVELANSTSNTVILTLETSLKGGQHLRAICGASSWPVLGLTHDLSSQEVYDDLLLTLLGKPKKFDAFVCTSRAAQQAISSLQLMAEEMVGVKALFQKIIIPLGIDSERLGSVRNTSQGVKSKAMTFLYLGRLSYAMKADLTPLISAIGQSNIDKSRFRLILSGSVISPDQETVKRYTSHIEKQGLGSIITIEENITDARRIELLSEADVLISPVDSFQETFGLVLLEAMAMGLPVIASDWSGYKEIIDDGKNGFLIPTLVPEKAIESISESTVLSDRWSWYGEMAQCVIVDYHQVIEKMNFFLENPEKVESMGQIGREKVASKFEWKKIIPTYQKECHRLCQLNGISLEKAQLNGYTNNLNQVFSHYPTSAFNANTLIKKKKLCENDRFPLECPPPFFNFDELRMAFESINGSIPIRDMPFSEHKAMKYASYFLKQNLAEIVKTSTDDLIA